MIRPLIAIMTCWQPPYVTKANAQRATWVQAVRQFADVKFFRGYSPHGAPQEPDVIELDVDDSYRSLPLKVQAMARWAGAMGYARMMKCDDDVFIIPERFRQIACGEQYGFSGRFRGPSGGFPAYYPSGFSYWLGAKEMRIVATAEHNTTEWMDERWIGNTLAFCGVYGHTDPTSYLVTGPFTRPDIIGNRAVLRDGTVFCQYGAPDMYKLWELYANTQPVRPKPFKLSPAPQVRVTLEQLRQPSLDKIPVEKTR